MADSVTTQSAVLATLPDGTVIATDDGGAGGHIQVIKLAISANGDVTPIPADATNGLDVDVTRIPATAADGGSLPALQIVIAGYDGTNTQAIKTDSSGIVQVDVDGSLPAGSANIGDVDVASIAAGDNNIGNVDVVTLPALPAGSSNIGDVDVLTVPADPFGANADAAVAAGATGSIQAKLRLLTTQLDAVKTAVETLDNTVGGSELQVDVVGALPAGTAAIGKLAANSGVDIGDVDVISAPARAATTDTITAKLATDAIQNGTTALTPKFAIIDAASSGDNTLLAAVASKKIRVLSLFMVASAAVTARFESGTGGTALSGQMNLAANGGFTLPFNPTGWFETGSGVLLNLELSGAISVDGTFSYVEV